MSEPDPTSEAAYYASIWGLSTPRMNELEVAFRKFLDYCKPQSAREAVRRLIKPDSIISVSEIHPEGFERKAIFNAVTYMTRTGELTRLGYGKYQSPPASG